MSAGIQGAFGDIGGAVSDLFASQGDQASAAAYTQSAQLFGDAATLAGENATLAKTSAQIQASQQQRQVNAVLGGQQADVAGAGFKAGGSNAYLLASSAQQGALSTALITQQGQINAIGFQQQQEGLLAQQSTDQGLASAASSAASGAMIGAGLKGIAGLFSLGAAL